MNKSWLLLLLTLGILTDCHKDDQSAPSDGIDFYLLTSFQTVGQTCQIEESSVATEEQAVIRYSELLSYRAETYTVERPKTAKARSNKLTPPVHGLAFALKAGRQLIYTGYFWPSYSSASCNWVTIDPLFLDRGLAVRLGYPGTIDGQEIPDRRNDPLLLEILERDNKLIR